MHRVDLNCDMGEGFGRYSIGNDEALLDHVTSANVACGFHAGDPSVMRRTVELATSKGVAVGAHPGYPDLMGFGRRYMELTLEQAHDLVAYQVGALAGIARSVGSELQHVKPHGALYNAAAIDSELADSIATAVQRVNPDLILLGLSDSELIAAGRRAGLRTASEAFADRTYQPDGTLTPRSHPEALVSDHETAAAQAVRLVTEGRVRSIQGVDVEVNADTICIHGDSPDAPSFAELIRARLEASEIEVRALRES
jgi:UPF0271 protein